MKLIQYNYNRYTTIDTIEKRLKYSESRSTANIF